MNLLWHASELHGIKCLVTVNNNPCLNTYMIDIRDVQVEGLLITGVGTVKGYKQDSNGRLYIDPLSTLDKVFAAEYLLLNVNVRILFDNESDLNSVLKCCVVG